MDKENSKLVHPITIVCWFFVAAFIGTIIGKSAAIDGFWWCINSLLALFSLITIPIYVEQKKTRLSGTINRLWDDANKAYNALYNLDVNTALQYSSSFTTEFGREQQQLKSACHSQFVENFQQIRDIIIRTQIFMGEELERSLKPIGYDFPEDVTKFDLVKNKDYILENYNNNIKRVYIRTIKGNVVYIDTKHAKEMIDQMSVSQKVGSSTTECDESEIKWRSLPSKISVIEELIKEYDDLRKDFVKTLYPQIPIKKKWKIWPLIIISLIRGC